MKWYDFQMLQIQRDSHMANRMHNMLHLACADFERGNVDQYETQEDVQVGRKKYVVVTRPSGSRLYWEAKLERWINVQCANPESLFQKKLALEEQLGVMAVFSLEGGSVEEYGDLQKLLLNLSPLVVTRAKQMLESEDERGKPVYEPVGLVTADYLTTDEIRSWEKLCEELCRFQEAA